MTSCLQIAAIECVRAAPSSHAAWSFNQSKPTPPASEQARHKSARLYNASTQLPGQSLDSSGRRPHAVRSIEPATTTTSQNASSPSQPPAEREAEQRGVVSGSGSSGLGHPSPLASTRNDPTFACCFGSTRASKQSARSIHHSFERLNPKPESRRLCVCARNGSLACSSNAQTQTGTHRSTHASTSFFLPFRPAFPSLTSRFTTTPPPTHPHHTVDQPTDSSIQPANHHGTGRAPVAAPPRPGGGRGRVHPLLLHPPAAAAAAAAAAAVNAGVGRSVHCVVEWLCLVGGHVGGDCLGCRGLCRSRWIGLTDGWMDDGWMDGWNPHHRHIKHSQRRRRQQQHRRRRRRRRPRAGRGSRALGRSRRRRHRRPRPRRSSMWVC